MAKLGQHLEEKVERARLAQSPKAFPHTIPVSKFNRQRPPSDIMHGEIVNGGEKFSVVASFVAPARKASLENVQRDRPIFFRHSRQHVFSSRS
jgi:hypothetical protein